MPYKRLVGTYLLENINSLVYDEGVTDEGKDGRTDRRVDPIKVMQERI